MYSEQNEVCNGCESHLELRHLEIDHIIPKKNGGTDGQDNLQLLCSSCNRIKGSRDMNFLWYSLWYDSFLSRGILPCLNDSLYNPHKGHGITGELEINTRRRLERNNDVYQTQLKESVIQRSSLIKMQNNGMLSEFEEC